MQNYMVTLRIGFHFNHVNFYLKMYSLHMRVAQKVIPHIFFLGNYLIRMYETHAQYNWMFPLHVLFFHIISI